ncbi:MAG: CHAT domain-containing protein [Cyclobacteriaceae bacterium]|nr:CHAT domain-containing protein [Cyclobacteriaceae bacterium]UYN85370.1 MAG: CHAT domain-containing protein [Cyclobacteriaceae bacterium]
MMRIVYSLLVTLIIPTVKAQTWDSLNTKGLKLYIEGNYTLAQEIIEKALIRAEVDSGKISSAYASSLTTLAQINKATGNYGKAADMFRFTIFVADKQYDFGHIDRIQTRVELANLFLESGQYDSCEIYLRKCLDFIQLAYTNNREYYSNNILNFILAFAHIQNSMASLHRRTGQLKKAITELEETITFLKEAMGQEVLGLNEYKTILSNLCNYYLEYGAVEKATLLNTEYISLIKNKQSLSYLYALQNHGNIFRRLEQTDSAIHSWQKALGMIEHGLYYGSQLHISILTNLGEVYSYLENYEEALGHLRAARALLEKTGSINPRIYQTTLLNLALTYFYNSNFKEADAAFNSLTDHLLKEVKHNFTYLSENEKISFYRNQRDILQEYLLFALTVSGTIPGQDFQNPDITKRLFDLQLSTKGIILNASHKMKTIILNGDNQQLKADYQRWEYLKNELAQLIRSETPSANQIAELTVYVEEMEIKLSRASASFKKGFLVEEISWRDIQKKLKPGEAAVEMVSMYNGLLYAALIVTKETDDRPRMAIVKGSEIRRLEKEYARQYINAINFRYTDTLSYAVYWKPIADAISQALPKNQKLKRVYFSPDGIYNQINLNTFYDTKSGKYLIDQVEIHQLINTKELVGPKPKANKSVMQRATLFGNPAFSVITSETNQLFTDLPGTEKEVDAIYTLLKNKGWSVDRYKGSSATETRLKSIKENEILHLATHGFFSGHDGQSNSLVWMLINSGVVLAGANQPALLDQDDGILTAYEAVNLNLDNTLLVVLSACETGLGEYYPGEGVYGLRLALSAAGASTIIMSLWKVDDFVTQQLMIAFYRRWLKHPGHMRAAFRAAQQEIKKTHPDPYYWGAFVLTGR